MISDNKFHHSEGNICRYCESHQHFHSLGPKQLPMCTGWVIKTRPFLELSNSYIYDDAERWSKYQNSMCSCGSSSQMGCKAGWAELYCYHPCPQEQPLIVEVCCKMMMMESPVGATYELRSPTSCEICTFYPMNKQPQTNSGRTSGLWHRRHLPFWGGVWGLDLGVALLAVPCWVSTISFDEWEKREPSEPSMYGVKQFPGTVRLTWWRRRSVLAWRCWPAFCHTLRNEYWLTDWLTVSGVYE